MIKGHAKIELTDVKTGEKQVVEHDNLFTDGLKKQIEYITNLTTRLNNTGYNNAQVLNSYFTPLSNNALGGIMLFEDTITENVNSYAIPENNIVVGYASDDGYSGDDTMRGSRNTTETESGTTGNKDYIKYVWDFSTSQANGQISCLSLVPVGAGKGFGAITDYVFRPLFSLNINGLGITNVVDFSVDTAVVVTNASFNSAESKVTFTKIQLDALYDYRLNNVFPTDTATRKVLSEAEVTIPAGTGSDIGMGFSTFNFTDPMITPHGAYYYIIQSQFQNKSGGGYAEVIALARIKKNNLSFDSDFGVKFGWADSAVNYSFAQITSGQNYAGILNGKLYHIDEYQKACWDIDTMESVQLSEEVSSSSAYSNPVCDGNGFLFTIGSGSSPGWVLFNDGQRMRVAAQSIIGYSNWSGVTNPYGGLVTKDYNHQQLVFAAIRSYLATVNNLDTPVTKTSGQTMKITYTLQEV